MRFPCPITTPGAVPGRFFRIIAVSNEARINEGADHRGGHMFAGEGGRPDKLFIVCKADARGIKNEIQGTKPFAGAGGKVPVGLVTVITFAARRCR